MLGVVIQYFYAQKWGEISMDTPPKKANRNTDTFLFVRAYV